MISFANRHVHPEDVELCKRALADYETNRDDLLAMIDQCGDRKICFWDMDAFPNEADVPEGRKYVFYLSRSETAQDFDSVLDWMRQEIARIEAMPITQR